MSVEKYVIDNNGVKYELAEKLGSGGQGSVYAVKGGKLAVKIVYAKGEVRRENLRNQLSSVRRLPLKDLSLAKPLEMLRPPHTGYVMELVSGMISIKSLLFPPKGESPSVEWYKNTGGLRRRLLILANTANILSQLHGKGLAFADPSPNNIFISEETDFHNVWFIDTDNLVYESSPSSKKGIYTPGYAAPELINAKSGITTLTDIYAFAVIAFQALVLAHPFVGDMVNDGEPELEEMAYAGKLPWIDDPSDDHNRASFGVPRDWVLSKRLIELFQNTFCVGLMSPQQRPGASEWAERLYAAADATITCPDCGSTYYFEHNICPWCDSNKPPIGLFMINLWDPSLIKDRGHGFVQVPKNGKKIHIHVGHGMFSSKDTYFVTRRQAFDTFQTNLDDPILEIKLVKDIVLIKSLDGNTYDLDIGGGKKTIVSEKPQQFNLSPGKPGPKLHMGAKDVKHRVFSFSMRAGS